MKYIDQVVHGDCLDLLAKVPTGSIDVTFADPPFNLKKKYSQYIDKRELEEYLEWCRLWIEEMVRVTKPTGSIFVHNIPKWLTYYAHYLNPIADFRHWIAWDAPTAPMGRSLQPSHYGVLFYAKDKSQHKFYEVRSPHKRNRKNNLLLKDYGGKKASLHPFGPLVSDVWTDIHRIKHNKYRDNHPCQLPVHLLERIVLMSSDEGDIILDPFLGTGTTAIAAKRLGRKFVGFEIDEKYVKIAKNKLSQEAPVLQIGSCWVSNYLGSISTLRDADWDELSRFFVIPKDKKAIDHTPIILKEKIAQSAKNKKSLKQQEELVAQLALQTNTDL